MMLGHDLRIEQTQKLAMTPELIQAIQILQYNSQELEEYIEEQLLDNPVLELSDSEGEKESEIIDLENAENISVKDAEIDWGEYFKQYDDISYRQVDYHKKDYDVGYEITSNHGDVSGESLHEYLLSQLSMIDVHPSIRKITEYLIECLDDNGYLTQSLDEISKIINKSTDCLKISLKAVQSLEPYGVGARSLKECLLIQLRHIPKKDEHICLAIQNHLEDIAHNRISNISKALKINCTKAQEIADFIKSMEPKPGRKFSSSKNSKYIQPDIIVEEVANEYVVSVNETSVPTLYLSNYYKKILKEENKESETSKFLSSRLNSALWLIKSIEQRKQTIHNVANAIIYFQEDFFSKGRRHLKPLTLKQVAEHIGMHESTVSRAISGKYIQSPQGMAELKYFFSSGVLDEYGHGVSSEGIKSQIQELISKEDTKKPISDQKITEILMKERIEISRRTVAKYRDEMGIMPSSKRRRY